jgi:hypothetical protein
VTLERRDQRSAPAADPSFVLEQSF